MGKASSGDREEASAQYEGSDLFLSHGDTPTCWAQAIFESQVPKGLAVTVGQRPAITQARRPELSQAKAEFRKVFPDGVYAFSTTETS